MMEHFFYLMRSSGEDPSRGNSFDQKDQEISESVL